MPSTLRIFRSVARAPLPVARAVAVCLLLAGCGRAPEPETRSRLPQDLPETAARRQIPEDSLYGATAAENFRVTPVEMEAVGLPVAFDGMRIVAIANPQLGLWPENEALTLRAVQRAVALNPDVIVLLGDYVARGGREQYQALARALAPLRGRRAAAVLSDRDIRNDTAEYRITKALTDGGIVVLRNERYRLIRGRDTVRLLGLDPKLFEEVPYTQGELLRGLPYGRTVPVLLSASPTAVTRLPANRYSVVLAGDAFCGRLNVPGAARLDSLEAGPLAPYRLPEVSRLYNIRGNILFLPCALGYSFVPARHGAAPELALITLRSLQPETPQDTSARPVDIDSLVNAYQGRQDSAQQVRAERARRDSAEAARDSAR